jgi:hypothetical protein
MLRNFAKTFRKIQIQPIRLFSAGTELTTQQIEDRVFDLMKDFAKVPREKVFVFLISLLLTHTLLVTLDWIV